MSVHQKQHPTPSKHSTPGESASPQELAQQTFHQHLREPIGEATRIVMEEMMREEWTPFLGAGWGESCAQRKGHRNGSSPRDLATTSGQIEDRNVPRDRDGQFHPPLFERENGYEQQVADGLTQMFVSGTATQKVGEVAQTLLGVAPRARSVSRLNQTLTEPLDAWRERTLHEHWRVRYLEGIHFEVRHGDQVASPLILVA